MMNVKEKLTEIAEQQAREYAKDLKSKGWDALVCIAVLHKMEFISFHIYALKNDVKFGLFVYYMYPNKSELMSSTTFKDGDEGNADFLFLKEMAQRVGPWTTIDLTKEAA